MITGTNFGLYGGIGNNPNPSTGYVEVTAYGINWGSIGAPNTTPAIKLTSWGNSLISFILPTKDSNGYSLEAGSTAAVQVFVPNNGAVLSSNKVNLHTPVASPQSGLAGSSNYIFCNSNITEPGECPTINGVTASIYVAEDLEVDANSGNNT